MTIMHTLTRSLLLSLALGSTFACAKPTTVAVNPVSGKVYSTVGSTLWQCDTAGEHCTEGAVLITPEDTAITPDSRMVFAAGSSIYVCNDEGQACIEVKLPGKTKAAGLSVSPSGEIFVVGTTGSLAVCTETKCRLVPDGKSESSDAEK
jgi:DNA-binding beta-propeller fold protein YncE